MLANLLNSFIRDGAMRLEDSSGRLHRIGDDGPPVCTIRLDGRLPRIKLVLNPCLTVLEGFMDGDISVVEGSLYDFLEVCARNYHHLEQRPFIRFLGWFDRARMGQYNPVDRARRNVAHHYDLSDDLYRLFLDDDRQYSCAYFENLEQSLEDAQLTKKRHIASKLKLESGNRILDIGCGWGGLGLYLAKAAKVDVTGLTLSVEQQAVAERRVGDEKLSDRVRFQLQDYRDDDTKYDRIVSVGMFEHVGRRNYREFFSKIDNLLKDDGVMLLHSIGRFNSPSPINPFIRKYIFPGADLPSLSEVMRAIEPLGLMVTDVEIQRLHYAETLRKWRERFTARKEEAARIYDERFCIMWEIYLAICELGFRYQQLMVFQIQITKSLRAVPLTRDYMFEWERQQAERDRNRQGQRAA
jgi:cyclopropane-fatty-acyl-phospholipid synthase